MMSLYFPLLNMIDSQFGTTPTNFKVVETFKIVSLTQITYSQFYLLDSQRPIDLRTEVIGKDDIKIPAARIRQPSEIFLSPYIMMFVSSSKGNMDVTLIVL